MNNTDNNNRLDELKLHPQSGDKFLLKSKLKRSEILEFESNKFDEQSIALAEKDMTSSDKMVIYEALIYEKAKLKYDDSIIMPNKNRLKKQTYKSASMVLHLTIPIAAAIILVFFIIRQNPNIKINSLSTELEMSKDENIASQKTEKELLIKNSDDKILSNNKIKITYNEKEKNYVSTQIKQKPIQQLQKTERELVTENKNEIREKRTDLINPIKMQTYPVSNKISKSNKIDTPNNAIGCEVIEIASDRPKSFFNKVEELISIKKDNKLAEGSWLDVKLQKRILNANSLIGENSTVINEYNESGALTSTQIISDGFTYKKECLAGNFKTNNNTDDIEVYIMEFDKE